MKKNILVSLALALVAFGVVLLLLFKFGGGKRREIDTGVTAPVSEKTPPPRPTPAPDPQPVADPGKAKPVENPSTPPRADNPNVLSGHVISGETGALLAGVKIRATIDTGRLSTEPSIWDLETVTDSKGGFELQNVQFSPFKVQASLTGMLLAEVDGAFPGEVVELKLSRQDAILCTLVLDGEEGLTPLPNQAVSIAVPGVGWFFAGESSADGALPLTGIRREDLELARKGHQIECIVPGFAEATLAAIPPGDAYRISCEVGATVDGSVLDSMTRRPIPGATVHADSGYEVAADENGRFRISGVGDDLTAYAPGYGFETAEIDADDPGQVVRHDFRLKRGITIHGKVKDRNGMPLPGFRISLPIDALDLESSSEKLEERLIESYTAVSDSSGEYRLEGLNAEALNLPADLELAVKAPGSTSSFTHEVAGVPDKGELEHDIVLDLQLSLEGTLLQASGEPLGKIAAYLESIDSDFLLASGTSAQGAFAFKTVPVDRYRLRFERNGRAIHVQEIEVPSPPLDIRIAALGVIEGLLHAADTREPLAAVQLSLIADAKGRVVLASGVATDSNGRFRIADVPQGEYKLVAKQIPATMAVSRFEPTLEFPVSVGAQGWKGDLAVPVLPSGDVAFSFNVSSRPGAPGMPVTASVWIAISSVRGPEKNWTAPAGGEPILVEDAQQGYRARWRAGEYKLRFSTTVEGKLILKDEVVVVAEGAVQERAVAFTR